MAASARTRLTVGFLLLVGVGLVLAGAAIAAVLVGLSVHRAAKVWPEGIPSLAQSEPALPPQPEARAHLDALFEAIPDDIGSSVDANILDVVGPPSVDDLASPIELQPALGAMDELVDCSGLVVEPWLLTDEHPPLIELLHLSRLRLARSWRYAEQDRGDEAMAEMLRTLRLGLLLQHAGGSLITTMVGNSIGEEALQEIVELVAWEKPPGPDLLAALAAELEATAALPPATPAAVLGECRAAEALYDQMRWWSRDQLFATTEPGVAAPKVESAENGGGSECCFLVYDADRTIQMLRQRCLESAAAGYEPGATRVQPSWKPLHGSGGLAVEQYLDNATGRILLDIATPAYGRFFEQEDHLRSRQALVRSWLAVQRQLREEPGGQPPAALDDLVPDLLAEVPVDPWDGKPVRYDAKQRKLWTTAGQGESADEELALTF